MQITNRGINKQWFVLTFRNKMANTRYYRACFVNSSCLEPKSHSLHCTYSSCWSSSQSTLREGFFSTPNIYHDSPNIPISSPWNFDMIPLSQSPTLHNKWSLSPFQNQNRLKSSEQHLWDMMNYSFIPLESSLFPHHHLVLIMCFCFARMLESAVLCWQCRCGSLSTSAVECSCLNTRPS